MKRSRSEKCRLPSYLLTERPKFAIITSAGEKMEKIKIAQTVLVEGKYDKIKLESIIDAPIVVAGGFSIFNNEEKIALLRRIVEKNGLIILTDSDPAGFFLRNKLKGMLPKSEKIIHLYIPTEKGKEKRKKEYSKAGLLGVEGIDADTLREIFRKYADTDGSVRKCGEITKAFFYETGLSGGEGSAQKRDNLAQSLDLPRGMSANALLEAINMLGLTKEDITRAL